MKKRVTHGIVTFKRRSLFVPEKPKRIFRGGYDLLWALEFMLEFTRNDDDNLWFRIRKLIKTKPKINSQIDSFGYPGQHPSFIYPWFLWIAMVVLWK